MGKTHDISVVGLNGGGEGYRTPVRKQTSLTFYERSLHIKIRSLEPLQTGD